MEFRFLVFLLLISCLTASLPAQVDQFAVFKGRYPDFGAMDGNWGHFQYYRPFGIKGIVVEDWRDLSSISPLTGEPYNTDRQGWIPLEDTTSLWAQLHPSLTAPADTLAPSTLVNYRQGDGIFKDFTLWYHNGLDAATRFGWTSKLRSHPRIIGATTYYEQRHRFQANTTSGKQYFQMEAGYDFQVNPLYMLVQDSNMVWQFDDEPQLRSKRWDGSFQWSHQDSTMMGSELFAWFQAGVWDWSGGERKSLASMAYLSHRFPLLGLGAVAIKVGYISKLYGGNKRAQQFAEFTFPELHGENYDLVFGVKSIGKSALLPKIDMSYHIGVFQIGLETHELIEERIWDPVFSSTSLYQLTGAAKLSAMRLALSAWAGEDEGAKVTGASAQGEVQFPWGMQSMFRVARVENPQDWVFTRQFINWELQQKIVLFQEALHGKFKFWGVHSFGTQPGFLDDENFQTITSVLDGEDVLHQLNYTISGEVSTVLISFTDQNFLQDDVWSQYAAVSWQPNYSVMANQIPSSRFRYLSIIWTFDN